MLSRHFTAVAACLDDPELPVRIQASLALTEMITVHPSGMTVTLTVYLQCVLTNFTVKAAVAPQVGKVIQSRWHIYVASNLLLIFFS